MFVILQDVCNNANINKAKIVNQILKSNTFRNWYYSRPLRELPSIRAKIIEHCGVKRSVFYNWLTGRSEVPKSSQLIINMIAGEDVFPVSEPISIKEQVTNE